jgi:hypothetical protein
VCEKDLAAAHQQTAEDVPRIFLTGRCDFGFGFGFGFEFA